MKSEEFELLVEEAVDGLPEEFKHRLENISIVVEDQPSAEVLRRLQPGATRRNLLGVYIGVPYTKRHGMPVPGTMPDRIELYQKNIEAYCRDDREIVEQIRETIIHEVGHYFGLDEETLRRLQG